MIINYNLTTCEMSLLSSFNKFVLMNTQNNAQVHFHEQCKNVIEQLGGTVANSFYENDASNANTYTVVHKNGTTTKHLFKTNDEISKEQQIRTMVKEQVKRIEKSLREPLLVFKKVGKFNFPSMVMEAPFATLAEMKALEKKEPLPKHSSF